MLIVETENFTLNSYDSFKPHHSRENGGHVVLKPKQSYVNRYDMPLALGDELMRFSMLAGEAMVLGLRELGLDIVRLNYQDNGNWEYKKPNPKPIFHWHIYGRTAHERHPTNDARFQAFPEAIVLPPPDTGYYDLFEPLSEAECAAIHEKCLLLAASEKYRDIILR